MNRSLIIINLFIIILSLVSCNDYNLFDESKDQIAGIDYPTTEEGNGYTITYKFNDATIVFDKNNIRYLHHTVSDSILFFDINTPSDLRPSIGSIISAPISNNTPYGLGNKVVSISNEDGYLKCITTSAPLDEIFDQLSFEYETSDISCLVDHMEVFDVDDNSWHMLSSSQKSRSDNEIKPISMAFPSLSKKGITLNGKVEITGKFHAEGDIDNGTFDFYFEPAIIFKGSGGVKMEYKNNLWQDINEYKYPFFRSPKTDIGVIPIGPIVLRPYIAAEGYFDFNASGSVLIDFEQKIGFRSGYSQANGGYMNNTGSDASDFIRDISINGNVGCKLRGVFDVGFGVYIKNVAAEIDPYFTLGFGADFREEALKNNSSVDCKFNFDVNAGMDAKFVVDLWRKLRLMPKVNIADFKLFHYDWSLIPIYEKNSLVIAGAGSPGTFDGNYIITGAPLARFWPLTPCINIYDIDYNLIQRKKIEGPIVCSSDYFVRFNLTGLNSGDYYIRPCIIYNGSDGNDIICESNEEYKITSKPSVKILDIRQTGCSATDHECSDNCGAHFDIKFDYDLVLQVDGCSNCIECGYCVEYIHDRWEYYSAPLSNGVHTISNTVLFGTDNPSFTVYPYVKYANGNIEVGEPFTTQFVGSRSRNKSSYKKANNNSPIISLPHP